MKGRTVALALSALLSTTCSKNLNQRLEADYGTQEPIEVSQRESRAPTIDYRTDAAPVFASRCVVCHGCYDAPCQLKLGALAGILRGASKQKVYNPSRLVAAQPTRLFEDASSTAEWRELDFFPVLNERRSTSTANREGSVLHRLLELKKAHPLPRVRRLDGFDFSLDREQVCPNLSEIAEFETKHPTWGMPYGLPGLSREEFETLSRWITDGAPASPEPETNRSLRKAAAEWEAFLNRDDNKSRLISRYLYEHWFLAHLYFPEVDHESQPTFFSLVRSKTPPGQPISRIATRRPFDDPGTTRVYYRLEQLQTPILTKNHIPLPLNKSKKRLLRELFFDASFAVEGLPSYEPKESANPFQTFKSLPIQSRYRFLLDEARFIMNGFIKGPVCRGQTSVNVINDRFWVVFLAPHLLTEADNEFYAEQGSRLALPAEESSTTGILANWLSYSQKEHRYLEAKASFRKQRFQDRKISPKLIWDGGGKDLDAAMTVFRHVDNATVRHGLLGPPPKTSWVLDYGVFERIHYLLVAGFDVFGNVGHQLNTRIYMDFLRMEAESNFLAFLPPTARAPIAARWYRGAEEEIRPFIHGPTTSFFTPAKVLRGSMNPEMVLYTQLEKHLDRVNSRVANTHAQLVPAKLQGSFQRLQQRLQLLVGGPVTYLPPVSFVEVRSDDAHPFYFTLVRDSAHTNILSIFNEKDRRVPEEDRLVVTSTLLGAYPNAFFQVPSDRLEEFGTRLALLGSEEDLDEFRDDFGVRRTSQGFWEFSDRLHHYVRSTRGVEAGWMDYNRLVNY